MTIEPVLLRCAKCGDLSPAGKLNADDLCELCAAIDSLGYRLEQAGVIHPELFKDRQLPPSDR